MVVGRQAWTRIAKEEKNVKGKKNGDVFDVVSIAKPEVAKV